MVIHGDFEPTMNAITRALSEEATDIEVQRLKDAAGKAFKVQFDARKTERQ